MKAVKRFLSVLTIFLVFIGLWLVSEVIVQIRQFATMDYHYYGFPLKFSEGGGMCIYGACSSRDNPLNFILDGIIWLAVSIMLYLIFKKILKKKENRLS